MNYAPTPSLPPCHGYNLNGTPQILYVARHNVHQTITCVIDNSILKERFRGGNIIEACPELEHNTCRTFLSKHAEGKGNTTELFVRVSRGLYTLKLLRKYGL